MSAPQWMPYVGVITGVLGTATGIAGTVMGWIAYRRSNQMKSLDLRLEVRKALNEVDQLAKTVNELLPTVKRSKAAIMNARGLFHSGAMKAWDEQFSKDAAVASQLTAAMPSAADLEKLNPEQLEAKAASVHKLSTELSALLTKLEASMAEDDRQRAALQQAAQNIRPRG